MSNLITEIYDKQAVVDNLNQLGELINSSLNAIVASAPKLQSPIEYLTAVQSISEIEKKNTEVTQAKAKALSDLDKAYQQADKAIQQSINLDDAEFQTQTKLTSQYKEKAKEQKQLLELERTRQQTMQNGTKLLQMEAKSEGELRMQQQQLIKAQQSLRVTNAEENALREKLIAKINANKEALKGMSDEVSKQRDNIGNYKSALDGLANEAFPSVGAAMKQVRNELTQLEALQASGVVLTAEQKQRYNDLNVAMGQLKDVQGDIAARTKILADDYRGMTAAMESVKLGVNIVTSLKAVTALLGDENEELAKTMAQIVAIQQTLNTITQIQNQLNKDGIIQTNLRMLAERDLTNATIAQTAATKASIVAMKTLLALQTAGKGIIGVFGAALFGMVKMIKDVVSSTEKAREEQEKQNQILKDAQDETLQYNNRLQQLNVELGHYRDVLNDIADSYTTAGQKANIFQKQSVTQLAMNALLKEYNKYLEEYAALALEISQHPGYYENREQDEKRLGYLYGMVKDLGEEAAAVGRNIGGAMSDSEKKIDRFQKLMGEIADVVEKVNAKSKELAETTKNQTENTDKERQSKEEELSVEEKLYLLRKKINEDREKQELPTLAKVTAKIKDEGDMAQKLTERYQKASAILTTEYLNALMATDDEQERARITSEYNIQAKKNEIAQYERLMKLLPENSLEYLKLAQSIAEAKKELQDYQANLNDVSASEKKTIEERKKAFDDMKRNIVSAFDAILERQNFTFEAEQDAWDEDYEHRRAIVENTIFDEEEKNQKLKDLDDEKTAHDKQVAKERAQIERKKAIFNNAIQSAEAMANAVASVGLLLRKETEGDTYSAIARYIAAIAAGVAAIATISTLIAQLVQIPQYAKGGVAEANKPFIAGEKGREIGFGVYSGKVYDFSKPTLFKANEPINIKNANETRQIINNNEYNKDVTLQSNIVVQVVDSTRIKKFFKLG